MLNLFILILDLLNYYKIIYYVRKEKLKKPNQLKGKY
jgi:hypothetical protein